MADSLDALGYRDQAIGVQLRRASGRGVLVGRARTTLWEEIDAIDLRPYELELAAVDACRAGEVIVAAAAGSMRSGVWGELLLTAARNRGCLGVIVDGAVRDVAAMHAMNFLVFAARHFAARQLAPPASDVDLTRAWRSAACRSTRATFWWPTTTAWWSCRMRSNARCERRRGKSDRRKRGARRDSRRRKAADVFRKHGVL